MAYVNKYRGGWASFDGSSGYLYIQQKDYGGSLIDITLENNAMELSNAFDGWESPVIGLRCEFFIENDKADYFDLFELLTSTEREFKVVVTTITPSAATIFEGFINVDAVSHGYLNFETMHLVASSYLSKLQYLYPTSIDTLQNMTFIDLIDEMLTSVGANYNIRVNCKLYADGDTLSAGQTLFNKNGIYTECFWENDIDRMESLNILESILLPLNCYLYWYDGYWYIEHYTDVWQTSIDYVEYTTGVSYEPTDNGSVENVSRSLDDVHDLVFANTSQTVKVSPGYRLLQIRLNSGDTLLLNLLSEFIRDVTPSITVPPISPLPDIREWFYISETGTPILWTMAGFPYKTIVNPVKRTFAYDTRSMGALLNTTFVCTVLEETSITLTFRYLEIDGELSTIESDDFSALYFTFGFILSFLDGATTRYIVYSADTDSYYLTTDTGVAFTQRLQVNVEATSFDRTEMSCEISINLPLGDVASTEGGTDHPLVTGNIEKYTLLLSGEKLWKRFSSGDPLRDRNLARTTYWGDFKISVSNDIDFNLIEGSINTDFLDKKEIDLLIADNANLNYTNGILRGTDLDVRTIEWTRDAITKMSLIDWFIMEKFRIYNATKQTISSSIVQSFLLPPFSLYTESKQSDKKFILTNQVYRPSVGEDDVSLDEYDNETEFNII